MSKEKSCGLCPARLRFSEPALCPKCTELVAMLNRLWIVRDKGDSKMKCLACDTLLTD